jgi:formyl-CoA transferase
LKKLKADEASVHAVNPNLIYARAAGLGDRGPRANDHCQDMTGMAYAGLLFTYSGRDDVPFAPPGAMNDVLTGTMVAFGTLAAILERQRTGKGQVVSGSLVQTSLWAQLLNFGSVANTTQRMVAYDRDRPRSALVNQYRCADGRWIAVAGILPRYWPLFCEAVGAQHLIADERFADFEAMVRNSAALVPLLDAHFVTASSEHWLKRMLARGLWAGPVNHLEDLADDPQIQANQYLTTLDDGTRTVAMPFTLHGYHPGTKPGPALGADDEGVLRELGVPKPVQPA